MPEWERIHGAGISIQELAIPYASAILTVGNLSGGIKGKHSRFPLSSVYFFPAKHYGF